MKLQILLSSYNGKDFLREQLDSLCAQTIGDIGILVRDDGSIDETLSILDNLMSLRINSLSLSIKFSSLMTFLPLNR